MRNRLAGIFMVSKNYDTVSIKRCASWQPQFKTF